MIKSNLAVALLAFAATGTASAENFNGPFVGAEAGWSHNKLGRASIGAVQLDVDKSKNALEGGLFAGYDARLGRLVLGAEGAISAGIKDSVSVIDSGATLTVDPKRTIEATGRAGALIDDATLVYARAGYANVRTATLLAGKDGAIGDTRSLSGWTAGGGVERMLTDGVSARIEYRFTDVRKDGAALKRHQLLAGVAFRF